MQAAGYEGRIMIAFDSAASEFYKDGLYDLGFKQAKPQKMTGCASSWRSLGCRPQNIVFGSNAFLDSPKKTTLLVLLVNVIGCLPKVTVLLQKPSSTD